jgi:signal transduction histidine kinase
MLPLFTSRAAFDAEVSRRALDATEQIIAEMGAEIHDDLIQRLSILRLYLDRLDRAKGDANETDALITSMNADFLEVVESVRRISRRLMPVNAPTDSLETRIRTLCQNMERPGGGTIHLGQTGSELDIPDKDAIHLLRIVQELIHNAIKHSAAWHVHVRLAWTETELAIEVEDDGTAFGKVESFLSVLNTKNNTLRMRAGILRAPLHYSSGTRGLLARITYRVRR